MPHDDLIAKLKAVPGVTDVEDRGGVFWVSGTGLDVVAMGQAMTARDARLMAVTGIPQAEGGETAVIYHYVAADVLINVKARTRNGALASLAVTHRPAAWAEREIKDLFAVTFDGHPDPAPLLRPAGHPEGFFRAPMCAAAPTAKR